MPSSLCPICQNHSENPLTVTEDSARRFTAESPLTILAYYADQEGLGDVKFGKWALFKAPLYHSFFQPSLLRPFAICERCIANAKLDMAMIHGGYAILTTDGGQIYGKSFPTPESYQDECRTLEQWSWMQRHYKEDQL